MQPTLNPTHPILDPFPFLTQPHHSLLLYLHSAPSMLSSVDSLQYLKLQTKYKHLILTYINNYNSLQKLKQIEKQIPEIILSHSNVMNELRGIEGIRKKLEREKERGEELEREIGERDREREELRERVRERKEGLVREKREYMKLRKGIDEIELKENKRTRIQKFIFPSSQQPTSIPLTPYSHPPTATTTSTFLTTLPHKLNAVTQFKIALKSIQKKQFKIIDSDIQSVLKNMKIKRNIQEVMSNADGWGKSGLMVVKGKDGERGMSTKCTSRKVGRNGKENETGGIFHGIRLESRRSVGSRSKRKRTDWQNDDEGLQDLTPLQLYQTICLSKEDLQIFTLMLNDMIYKKR